ncbi:DUF664 domain-containing protein [Streptomyces sp. ME03-5709C]|nr:DUF664 domain-containing protein [Streptomyces sp. ME03-5709C]
MTGGQRLAAAVKPCRSPPAAVGHGAPWIRSDGAEREAGCEPVTRRTPRRGADVGEAFAVWCEECARARVVASSFDSLDDTVDFRGETVSLRYVLTHMIEEYARHNGHGPATRSNRRNRRRVRVVRNAWSTMR